MYIISEIPRLKTIVDDLRKALHADIPPLPPPPQFLLSFDENQSDSTDGCVTISNPTEDSFSSSAIVNRISVQRPDPDDGISQDIPAKEDSDQPTNGYSTIQRSGYVITNRLTHVYEIYREIGRAHV